MVFFFFFSFLKVEEEEHREGNVGVHSTFLHSTVKHACKDSYACIFKSLGRWIENSNIRNKPRGARPYGEEGAYLAQFIWV